MDLNCELLYPLYCITLHLLWRLPSTEPANYLGGGVHAANLYLSKLCAHIF